MAQSEFYRAQWRMYEQFSRAQDARGDVRNFLATIVQGKSVVDVGCGNGKFVISLHGIYERCTAVDKSEELLRNLTDKIAFLNNRDNICVMQLDLLKTPLSTAVKRADVALLSWVLGTIDPTYRQSIIDSVRDVAREVILVENAVEGEFERLRKANEQSRHKEYRDFLSTFASKAETIESVIEFDSLKQAQEVMGGIWQIAQKDIQKPSISHVVDVWRVRAREDKKDV